MSQKIYNTSLILLLTYLITGIYLSLNTGISHDEYHEQLNWEINLKAIKSFYETGYYKDLLEYKDRYHGIGFNFLSQPFQYLIKDFLLNYLDINEYGNKFSSFDCSKLKSLKKNLNKKFKKYGVPNILINCSYPIQGNWSKNNFENLNLEDLKSNIDVHLLSYTIIANEVAKKMVAKNIKGKIILLSSIYGFLAQNPNNYKKTNMRENVTYALIKSGIIGLVKQMAFYYGKKGLEVNSVSPGAVQGHVKGMNKKQDKKFISQYSSNTALKRLAKPKEVANLIKFLSSNECSYITGQNLIIDGGYSSI